METELRSATYDEISSAGPSVGQPSPCKHQYQYRATILCIQGLIVQVVCTIVVHDEVAGLHSFAIENVTVAAGDTL